MKRWNLNSVVLRVEITPTWRKVMKAFWIGYAITTSVVLLTLILLLCNHLYGTR
jgi:hypothetical protein